MNKNKKTIIGIVLGLIAVAAIIIGIAFTAGSGTESTPVKTPVAVDTPAPSDTSAPAETPADEDTIGVDEYNDTFVEYTAFAEGESLVVTVGGVTKDCGAETLMTATAYIDGYSVNYADAEHNEVASISCSQSGAGDLFAE